MHTHVNLLMRLKLQVALHSKSPVPYSIFACIIAKAK